jgi:hypothetical protein
MNERIFKLALKAMDFQGAVDIDTELKMTNSELAKFAVLIVEECAQVAKGIQDFYDEHNDSQVNTEICTMIKLHFGVEP